jgi:hypothetical protein
MARKAANHDFTIERDGTFKVQMSIKDSNGDLVPIPNTVVQMDLRRNPDDEDAIISLTEANSRVINDYSGVLIFTISDEDTAKLNFRKCFHDIRISNTSTGESDYILFGNVINERTVTR